MFLMIVEFEIVCITAKPLVHLTENFISLIFSKFFPLCICEPEITLVLYHLENQNKNNFTFDVQFTNLAKRWNKHCRALEILKKIWICLTFI